MKRLLSISVVGAIALAATTAFASENIDAKVTLRGSEVLVNLGAGYFNATLSISGPNGFYAKNYSQSGSASIDLIRAGGLTDGVYSYEVTVATSETTTNLNPVDNGRGGVDDGTSVVSASTSGSFHASGGIIADRASQAAEE